MFVLPWLMLSCYGRYCWSAYVFSRLLMEKTAAPNVTVLAVADDVVTVAQYMSVSVLMTLLLLNIT